MIVRGESAWIVEIGGIVPEIVILPLHLDYSFDLKGQTEKSASKINHIVDLINFEIYCSCDLFEQFENLQKFFFEKYIDVKY